MPRSLSSFVSLARGAISIWSAPHPDPAEREFFIDNLLVRIHFIIVMIRWTGLAPWEFELPFPGSLASTFLVPSLSGLPLT